MKLDILAFGVHPDDVDFRRNARKLHCLQRIY